MIQSKIRLPLVRVACALALALAGVVLFLQSQVASAATIFFSARGGNSFAFFQSVDSTGCLTTSVEVDAGENAV